MPSKSVFRLTKTKVAFKSLSAFIIIYMFALGNTSVSTGQEVQTEFFFVSIQLIFNSTG